MSIHSGMVGIDTECHLLLNMLVMILLTMHRNILKKRMVCILDGICFRTQKIPQASSSNFGGFIGRATHTECHLERRFQAIMNITLL